MAEPATSSGNPERPAIRAAHDDLPEILRAARRGEPDAWATLVARFARRVYAFARSKGLSPEHAEEVAQSVFASVSVKVQRGQYDERGSFEAWLFHIAANRVRDSIRASRRRATAIEGLRFTARRIESAPPADALDEPASEALRDALAALPDADREVVDLRHHAGMAFKDIAALLGEPVGTVLARHHRALRKMRATLEARLSDPETP